MISHGSILIVDDEAGPRESLRMILKSIYEVHIAENGHEAITFMYWFSVNWSIAAFVKLVPSDPLLPFDRQVLGAVG